MLMWKTNLQRSVVLLGIWGNQDEEPELGGGTGRKWWARP